MWPDVVLVSVGVVDSASSSSDVVDRECELVCGDVCACCGVGSGEVDNVDGIMALLCVVDMVGFGGDGVGFVVAIYVAVVVDDI